VYEPVGELVFVKLTIYRDENGFAELQPAWNSLLARSRSDNLFLTWEWQSTWWRCLGTGDLWLLAWHQDATLVGIAALYLATDQKGTRRLALVGCIEVSDYLDVIADANYAEPVLQALLAWLTGPDAPAWDVLDLCNLPQVSPTPRQLPELAAGMGLAALTEVDDVCPVIALPDDWEVYLEQVVNKKQRHEIRRKLRRIEREARVHCYVVGEGQDLAEETAAFIELHRLSTQEKHSFMTPDMQAFFQEMTQAMAKAGWLYLTFIEVNGDRAAAMLGFLYHDHLLIYNSGYDPQAYADLSPGIVLTSYTIQDAIGQGVQVFDFLQGDEVYKYRFGATDTVVYRTQVWRDGSKATPDGR
jgi:CelD/BcsL family acetyltransferase involved in cellulose biosynthesis